MLQADSPRAGDCKFFSADGARRRTKLSGQVIGASRAWRDNKNPPRGLLRLDHRAGTTPKAGNLPSAANATAICS